MDHLNVFHCVNFHGNVSIFPVQALSIFNNATPSFCSSAEGVINCESKCVCRCAWTYVCYSSTSSHLGNRPCSLHFSFFLSLGTHSFRPNPVHSLLILTLVPEAICRLRSSCFCGNKEKKKIILNWWELCWRSARWSPSIFSQLWASLFTPVTHRCHTYLMWTTSFWGAPFPKIYSWVHNSRQSKQTTSRRAQAENDFLS